MLISHTITFVKALLAQALDPGDIAVDATVGNGIDTEFLARQVGPGGRVFGFDIQATALESARKRLDDAGLLGRVSLLHTGHETMGGHLPQDVHGRVAAVMFNLGYLPQGDERIVTRPETTCAALDAALDILRPGGVASMVLYTGHPGGEDEARAVLEHCACLSPNQARVRRCDPHNHPQCATRLLFLERR